MSDLAVNKPRTFALDDNRENIAIPVAASTHLYEGAAVGLTSGYLDNADASAGFIGFLVYEADNSDGSAGDIKGVVKQRGIVTLSVADVTGVTDVGSTVYLSDSDTFELGMTGNQDVGTVVEYISGTKVKVYFEGTLVRSI